VDIYVSPWMLSEWENERPECPGVLPISSSTWCGSQTLPIRIPVLVFMLLCILLTVCTMF